MMLSSVQASYHLLLACFTALGRGTFLSWVCCAAGNRSSNVLIGIQVPPEDCEKFKAAIGALAEDYTFTELAGEARPRV